MEFVKLYEHRPGRVGSKIGSIVILKGKLRVSIYEPYTKLSEIGIVEGGVGVVVERGIKERKTKYVRNLIPFDKHDIPIELQGEKYRFAIPAEKVSDDEYVFMFKNAKMLNKK